MVRASHQCGLGSIPARQGMCFSEIMQKRKTLAEHGDRLFFTESNIPFNHCNAAKRSFQLFGHLREKLVSSLKWAFLQVRNIKKLIRGH